MNSETKIPTMLGLGVLLAGLIIGVFLVTSNNFAGLRTKASPSASPKNITLTNVSDTTASIYWQTDQPNLGFIQAGTSTSLELTFSDERDSGLLAPHQFHFVTLTNLTPDTTYYYKINSDSLFYPSGTPLSFKTASVITPSNHKPIVGTVLDTNLQPVTEAMVLVEIPEAQNLAAITKISGNFILPLSKILTKNLAQTFTFPQIPLTATLTVFNSEKSARIKLPLPNPNPILPPIILGKDLDIISTQASQAAKPPKYDLNDDGVINANDLSLLLKNFSSPYQPASPSADFNQDGIVDQKDVELLNTAIQKN